MKTLLSITQFRNEPLYINYTVVLSQFKHYNVKVTVFILSNSVRANGEDDKDDEDCC